MACPHPSSLIYFDRINGVCTSWEICDVCGQSFNDQTHESPEEVNGNRAYDEWSNTFHFTNPVH